MRAIVTLTLLIVVLVDVVVVDGSDGDGDDKRKKQQQQQQQQQTIVKKQQQQRGISFYLPKDHSIVTAATKKASTTKKQVPKYSCAGKEDEGHYEHSDCKKYWQCLYVGTIFETAVERKCPIGTMFHPIERVCEISTMVCLYYFPNLNTHLIMICQDLSASINRLIYVNI